MSKFNWQFTPLILIVVLAFSLRLYRINYPLLDWHSFRQADTASVTREFVKHGINLLEPKYQDLSSIQSGLNNLEGYRMVEFPIINALTATLIRALPFLPLVATSRVVSILFSLGTLLAIYFLVEMISGKRVALMASLSFAVTPYIIYYSRAILPETALACLSTLSILGFAKWLKSKSLKWYFLSLTTLALSFLLKPFVVFTAPVYLALAWRLQGKKLIKNPLLYIYPAIALVPLLWWREWIKQFPSGIPDSVWLYNGNGIRLRPAWFRWLGYERLSKLILGFVGVVFLPLSLLDKHKDSLIYFSWWLGMLIYFIVIATGNIQHDYYQYLITPILAISVGKGAVLMRSYLEKLLEKQSLVPKFHTPWMSLLAVSVVYLTMLGLSWNQVKGFFNINHWEARDAGEVVDKKTPADAKVIAPHFGDTAFLFQTNRTGWPIGGEIEEKIKLGATYYVTLTEDEEAKELANKYFVVEKTDKYLLIDLTKQKESTP